MLENTWIVEQQQRPPCVNWPCWMCCIWDFYWQCCCLTAVSVGPWITWIASRMLHRVERVAESRAWPPSNNKTA